MGHRVGWDNETKTVVLQEYTDPATKDDLYHLALKSSQLLAQYEHTIHIIVDERLRDFGLNSADMNYLEKILPKNQGMVIVVIQPENLTYKTITQQISKRIGPNAFRDPVFVETLEEARRILQQHFGVYNQIDPSA